MEAYQREMSMAAYICYCTRTQGAGPHTSVTAQVHKGALAMSGGLGKRNFLCTHKLMQRQDGVQVAIGAGLLIIGGLIYFLQLERDRLDSQ